MKIREIPGRLRGSAGVLTFVDEKGNETRRTFDALHADVQATVRRLHEIGLAPGCRIGIAAPSGYAWMVWDLACAVLECVSVALPNEKPQRGLEEVVEAYHLTLLAVHPEWLPPSAPLPHRVVDISRFAPADEALVSARPLRHAPHTHSLVFSSGTTGRNKGLIVSAAGTEDLIDLYHDAFGVEPGERFLTFLPFANYQQRMVYYFCLYHGVDFVSVPFQRLFPSLQAYRPTFAIAPPVLYETLYSLTRAGAGTDPEALAARLRQLTGGNIRYMITGMAPIKRNALDFFWECGVPLYEAFGITEAGMVAWNKPGRVRVGTVGTPAEPGSVTLAEDGEVIIRREALLSLGYFEASDEDARTTFLAPNAVATGDIGEFDDDGFLRVIGRKKDAIITNNGEKFHPEPIESLICRDPRIDVAVVLAGERPGLSVIVATRAHEDGAVTQALREHIATVNETLPAQQQLRHIVFTGSEFTADNGLRTRNLKLNRKAIAAAFLAQP